MKETGNKGEGSYGRKQENNGRVRKELGKGKNLPRKPRKKLGMEQEGPEEETENGTKTNRGRN